MISGSADLATSNGRQTCSRFQVSDTVSCKCTGRRYEPGWRCVAEKQCKVPKLGEFWSPQVFPSLIHFRRSIHSRDFPMSHPCHILAAPCCGGSRQRPLQAGNRLQGSYPRLSVCRYPFRCNWMSKRSRWTASAAHSGAIFCVAGTTTWQRRPIEPDLRRSDSPPRYGTWSNSVKSCIAARMLSDYATCGPCRD